MKIPKLLAALIFCMGFAAAQDAKPLESLARNPVFQKNCAKCHGKTAEGRFMGGPSLVSEKARSMPTDDLRQIITNGKHRMPKFDGKLAPAEIDALVDQIKSAEKQK